MRYQLSRLLLCLCLLLGACTTQQPDPPLEPRVVATLMPTLAALPVATAAPAPADSGWQAAEYGLELRSLRFPHPQTQQFVRVIVLRADPARVRFRVRYTPDNPRVIAQWFADQAPLALINGGFFTEDYQATALIISDGSASGQSYQGFGGMFAVSSTGELILRYLGDAPYSPQEPLREALQSFPMLVRPGGIPYAGNDTDQPARRSVIARDTSGRMLFLVAPGADFTLRDLAEWLLASDLQIESALNLDGGASSGMYLHSGEQRVAIDSFSLVPSVIEIVPGP